MSNQRQDSNRQSNQKPETNPLFYRPGFINIIFQPNSRKLFLHKCYTGQFLPYPYEITYQNTLQTFLLLLWKTFLSHFTGILITRKYRKDQIPVSNYGRKWSSEKAGWKITLPTLTGAPKQCYRSQVNILPDFFPQRKCRNESKTPKMKT